MHDHDDFDFEDSPGIPAPLPVGEHVLWQGSPDFKETAKHAFHIRKIAIYFAIIVAIQTMAVLSAGEQSLFASLAKTLLLSGLGLAILTLFAYLTSRVTIYTITNKRILIRFGIALQMTINLPFTSICAADMREGQNGIGDIPLTVIDKERVSYLVLWPHVRPWQFSRPQPMLRCIPNVGEVAKILGHVVQSVAVEQSTATPRFAKSRTTQPALSGAPADAVLLKPEVS